MASSLTRKEFLARSAVFAAFAATAASAAPAAPSASPPPRRRVSLADFGVVAGAPQPCTAALQAAIDSCADAGGGTVVIPAGTYTTGTVRLRTGVRLDLEHGATLLGSTNRAEYPVQPTPAYRSLKDAAGFRALIYAEGQEDIALTGSGTIDGQGAAFPYGRSDLDGRPRLIQFVSCRDVQVEGLRLRNSALWMQHYLNCERVQVRGLKVWNHANHNNDMIDIDGCRVVTISDCLGDCDDDGITLKATGPAGCEHVTISNCVVSSRCNAIKCGTESTGGFRNIAISNCVIKPTASDLAISGDREGISGLSLELVDGGQMDGVVISNVAIEGTLSPIFVRLGNRARKHRADAPAPPMGSLRNIRIENVIARSAGTIGSSITGVAGHRVENITLRGIHIELAAAGKPGDVGRKLPEREDSYPEAKMWGRLPACGFFIRHASRVKFDDVTVTPAAGEPRPVIVTEDAVDCSGLAAELPRGK